MKASTAIGIGVAFGSLMMSSLMGGTSPASFIDIPALMIILGGTGGVTLASVGMASMKRVPSLYKLVFSAEPPDMRGQLDKLVSLADKARREGLLALDGLTADIEDNFTRKGLQLVVDGSDPELVREVLEAEIDGMMARHHEGAGPFEKAGGFAPTMGIIGTVMGLVHVLQNLAAPATLGPSISSAFIATLMGVGSANVIYLPIANRLKALSKAEVELRTLTLEGILSGGKAILQSGSESTSAHTPATSEVPSIVPLTPNIPKPVDTSAQQISKAMLAQAAAQQEQSGFQKLKVELDAYAKAHGFSAQVQTVITRQGLVVRVLTDNLLFASGQATLEPAGEPLLNEVIALLNVDRAHPITVEGNTDNQPIQSAEFPSNWELSAIRATTVLRYLLAHGVTDQRLSAAGFADLHPIASNATAAGRAKNRRVDIVLDRIYPDLTP